MTGNVVRSCLLIVRASSGYTYESRRLVRAFNSNYKQPSFPNRLDRNFKVEKPNQVWAGDITSILTQVGWLYLAVVIDFNSRKIVGWSLGKRLTSTLVCEVLSMSIWARRPVPEQLIFRRKLKAHGIEGSMTREENCWDSAAVESFFGSLKSERIYWRTYQNREEARADIIDYIVMFYNSYRLHSYLGYWSQCSYEAQMGLPLPS